MSGLWDAEATCWQQPCAEGDIPRYSVCDGVGKCVCPRPVSAWAQMPVFRQGTLVHVISDWRATGGPAKDGLEGGYTVVGFDRGTYRLARGSWTPGEVSLMSADIEVDRRRVVHGFSPRPGGPDYAPGSVQPNGCQLDLKTERFTQCQGHWRCCCRLGEEA